jgi:hypothetical protein
MNIAEVVNNQKLKAKAKTETLSAWLNNCTISIDELVAFAVKAKDADKATCMEAIEFTTKKNPEIINKKSFDFAVQSLTSIAPRVKWESAKVIANTAYLFPGNLSSAIKNLFINSEHEGTVVRWASAFALGEILKLKTKHNKDLLPAMEAICNREQETGVKKKYLDAIKKTKKQV